MVVVVKLRTGVVIGVYPIDSGERDGVMISEAVLFQLMEAVGC